ncbi:MAG: class I SAM-dependent methyltransferase [Bacteroidota bacterium]
MDKKDIHNSNQTRWEAASDNWAKCADSRGIWRKSHEDPSLVFEARTIQHLKDIKGKKAAVLGSGDNEAVFALAGMGAIVTSTDISQNQLDNAAKRAKTIPLDIEFIQQDVTQLDQLLDNSFDLVYTGGHVAVWVADLKKYYQEAARILKPGGLLVIEEYHPFRRVWKASKEKLEVGYPYFEQGPYKFYYNDDVLYPVEGGMPSYEFHYSVGDFMTAVIQAGCEIKDVYEFGDQYEDWEVAPMKGLPEFLSIVARKT